MRPIEKVGENIPDDETDTGRHDDDGECRGNVEWLNDKRNRYHVRPLTEFDKWLFPSEQDKKRPENMHTANEHAESETCLDRIEVWIHSNKVILLILSLYIRHSAVYLPYMAETSRGNKFVKVHEYTYVQNGKKIRVHAHDRSTPFTSKGKKK